jgi:hypothetical protein
LLVTEDSRFADEFVSAAAVMGVDLVLASGRDDVEASAMQRRPSVLLLDARGALARMTRIGTVFATLHPSIVVVLVADETPRHSVGNLRIVSKWRSAERLLGELELSVLGLDGSD